MEFGPFVNSILILDLEGKRVASKFYSDERTTNEERRAFEKTVFTMTHMKDARTEADVTMHRDEIIVFKFIEDLHFYVTGGEEENEILLATVLEAVLGAIYILLKKKVNKMAALIHLDLVLLCIDEAVDGGIIVDTDAKSIARKVTGVSLDPAAEEQTMGEALKSARGQVMKAISGFSGLI
ncbi:coatomer subunit zeta-1-like [Salvia hispanica]|uniref:coatomer subunit zeta-1-like n=1 Tax=Salvia hispanica TaxID=49212 RepID=UPI0020092F5A|nr:coatomer subunit zeta-1-like [Salvia hispanica]